jgi:hypothetical protein
MSNINLGVWENFKNEVKYKLETDKIENFFNWDVIVRTMVAGIDDIEFQTLLGSKYWPFWEKNLEETILKPNSYSRFPPTSTNNAHHAYSLDVLMNFSNLMLNEYTTVLDFGGGYGNTCRLFKKCGHNDNYIIYDIPELIQIQKFYLESNNLNEKIIFKSNEDKVENIKSNSLFLALWSLTETPVFERKKMLDNLNFFSFDNIFIAMGKTFFNENNIEWLNNEIIPNLKEHGHNFELKEIKHGIDMFYFMSKK